MRPNKGSAFRIKKLTDGTVRITVYTGSRKVVVVPAEISDFVVSRIGDGAFKEKGITSVTLPNGIEEIGSEAFKSNLLTSISIPNTVRIKEEAEKKKDDRSNHHHGFGAPFGMTNGIDYNLHL